jgi:transcriptional regulator with XRE-family HTH domain
MPTSNTSKTLGARIRRAREREGLTQADLADKVGVTAPAISNWEAGTEPRGINKSKLEAVLGNLSKKTPKSSGVQEEQVPTSPDSEVSSFGIWLRDQRLKAAMSVPELARSANISAVALYNIESGKIQNPQAATRDKLATALKQVIPKNVVTETEKEQAIVGLGNLTDFDPYSRSDWPQCSGVYVLYDISQRPIYVGKATKNISTRLGAHFMNFWFKDPIVRYGSYIEVKDPTLCHQLEQAMIKFLKSNAVINKQSSEDFDER